MLHVLISDAKDVSSDVSKLTADLHWTDELYFFIEKIILVSWFLSEYPDWSSTTDRTSTLITQDLFSLIEDNLYIHELAALSVNIPTERYTFNLQYFGVYIQRASNEPVICIFDNTNTTVIISQNDTDDILDVLDSVDVVITTIDGNKTDNVTFIEEQPQILTPTTSTTTPTFTSTQMTASDNGCNGNNKNSRNGTGKIESEEVSITLSHAGANNTPIHNLTDNVVIEFNTFNFDSSSGLNQLCMWYDNNQNVWSTSGCATEIDVSKSKISCYCSHLTKFAVITALSYDESGITGCKISLNDFLGIGDYIVHFCSVFFVCFLSILLLVLYKIYCLWKTKLLTWNRYAEMKESFNALIVCGVCGFLQSVACILIVAYNQDNSLQGDNIYVEILTLFLAVPLLLYFVMFTQALQGWIAVTNSLNQEIGCDEKRKIFFTTINFIVCILFGNLILLLLLDIDLFYSGLLLYGEVIWLAIMGIACISFAFYSVKLRRLLSASLLTVSGSQDRRSADEQKKTIRRLSLVSVVLSLFFTLQTVIGIYGVYIQVSETNYDVSLAILDLFLNLMYLAAFLYLYIPNINRILNTQRKS